MSFPEAELALVEQLPFIDYLCQSSSYNPVINSEEEVRQGYRPSDLSLFLVPSLEYGNYLRFSKAIRDPTTPVHVFHDFLHRFLKSYAPAYN